MSTPPHPVPPPAPLHISCNPCRQRSTPTTQTNKTPKRVARQTRRHSHTHTHLFLVGGNELAEEQSPRGVHSRVRQKALRRRALDHALLPVQRHLRSRRRSNRNATKKKKNSNIRTRILLPYVLIVPFPCVLLLRCRYYFILVSFRRDDFFGLFGHHGGTFEGKGAKMTAVSS